MGTGTMRRWGIFALALALTLAAPAPALARDTLGVFNSWGAFRDNAPNGSPRRCYAIATPEEASTPGIYVTIGFWPAARVRSQIHFRLARAVAADAQPVLRIDDRRFPLIARGQGLWAADPRADATIIAALRGGSVMQVGAGNQSAIWPLRGAATAIDAAALGCARG